MEPITCSHLLSRLEEDTRRIIAETSALAHEDEALLTTQPAENKWSVAQVLQHLVSYGRYYLPQLEKAITQGMEKGSHPKVHYKAGWLGDYFTKVMLPGKDGNVSMRMPAPKDHRPGPVVEIGKVMQEFQAQQETLLDLMEKARRVNISRLRVPITLSRFIKLRMGDTFRVLVAHEQRHFAQIARTLAALSTVNGKYPASHPAG